MIFTDETYAMVVVMGAPGSGKTSLVDQIARDAIRQRRPVHIIDPSAQFPPGYLPGGVRGDWPKGGAAGVDAWLAANLGKFHGLLILDDADAYIPKFPGRGTPWNSLLVAFRHHQIDLVLNTRRLQEVPPLVRTNASHLAIFRTRSDLARQSLGRNIPEELLSQIPTEPHRFLLVDVDKGDAKEYRTNKRPINTAADRKI